MIQFCPQCASSSWEPERTGSYLAHLLVRQGAIRSPVGDRDLDRAHHFLGKKSKIPVVQVKRAKISGEFVSAARGSQLLVNSSGFLLF